MRRSIFILLFLWLLLSLLPMPLPEVAPSPAGLQAMPPHPRLWEKFEQGEISLPRFITDPAYARSLGIDHPRGRPRSLTGAINALAVVVDFNDKVHTVTANFFDTLIFAAPVAGRGSVRDYYSDVSYAQVDIVTVNLPSSLGWKRAPQTYAYYVGYCGANCGYCGDSPYPNNCQKLAEDIVDAVNGVVNFSNYDNDGDGYAEPIMLIHAGPGAEFTGDPHDIWSHSWSLRNPRNYDGVTIADYVIMPEYWTTVSPSTSDMTIGVFVHEMGHGFWNLPDLYDRDYSSRGIGRWSLMAGGSWNGPNSGGWGSDGSSPAWPDAWSRVQMGFAIATNILSNVSGKQIPQAYNNPPPAQTVLKLRSSALAGQEYFLLENRQRTAGTYDEYLPGDGLLIWHVDEAMWNYSLQNDYECTLEPHCNCNDAQHYLVALEQADGNRDLELKNNSGDAGDPFPGTTNNRNWTMTTHPESSSWYACNNTCIGVTNIGDSGPTMTADLQVSCGPPPSHWIYLPLVLRHLWLGGPTPTPAPSPTPLPCPLLGNGDFEQGPVVWTQYSQNGWDLILNSGWPGSVHPHSGVWAVWEGGDYNEVCYIQQQVLVPAATPYFRYYHWIASQDYCGYDFAYVRVNGVTVDQYDLCSANNTGGWVTHVVNLSAYANQCVTVQIRVETDSSLNSNLFIDDVAFQGTPLGGTVVPLSFDPDTALPRSGPR
ncbi:MAG: M6 family metalloprotease domain-containing protein [Chloroflexia bacterium]